MRSTITLVSAVVLATSCASALAHSESLVSANITLQYREPIGPDGDQAQARARIMAQADKDCETASKAFGRRCVINNINFNNNQMAYQIGTQFNQGEGAMLSASVNAALIPDPVKPR